MEAGVPIAVVTGGASGIGRATAVGLAAAGYAVAIADVDDAGACETLRMIEADGGSGGVFQVDMADDQSVVAMARAVCEELGQPAVLVNNAGWDEIRPFAETDMAFREKVLFINLRGVITASHSFLPALRQTQGRIVNVASDAGRVGSSGETVYAGAKGGVIAFTKSLAREVARDQMTVNCVCPGPTSTPFLDKSPENLRSALLRAIPMRRLAQPEDVANAILFFSSPAASYITGQVVSVSGGLTMNG